MSASKYTMNLMMSRSATRKASGISSASCSISIYILSLGSFSSPYILSVYVLILMLSYSCLHTCVLKAVSFWAARNACYALFFSAKSFILSRVRRLFYVILCFYSRINWHLQADIPWLPIRSTWTLHEKTWNKERARGGFGHHWV
jgi:hypothetical protein